MTNEELRKILAEHEAWLADPATGMRANLREASLRGARLRRADLQGADLRGADVYELSVADPRGYRCVAVQSPGGAWTIFSGCREFSPADALAHWGASDYHTPWIGQRYIAALNEFAAYAAIIDFCGGSRRG